MNPRVTIAGHRQRLAELTHHALLAWLKYRQLTWPRTPNRHVLITRVGALGSGPVTASHLDRPLRTDTPLEHIRRDRILQEALATGADSLHLALVFNIDHTTATAYANSARRILDSELEQPTRPRTPG